MTADYSLPHHAQMILLCLALLAGATAQGAAAPRPPDQLVAELCATCHTQTLIGNPGPNLLDHLWTHGGDDDSILRNIRQGFPNSGMPAFGEQLTGEEMRGLLRHIRAQSAEYRAGRIKHPVAAPSVAIASERQAFRLDTYVDGLETPWGLEFLPDGRILVSEREGRLRVIEHGRLQSPPVRGTPEVFPRVDGGLLDVIAHPDYAKNGWIYLAYCEAVPARDTSMTVVVRGRIRAGQWVEAQEIFRAAPAYSYPNYIHYGCRFLFDRGGHLFFTIGDRGQPDDAQDLTSPCGKIHRVLDDGRIPPDNPFAGRTGACQSIWSYGHRHPQGLQFHPLTGKLWATEHGPTGGDELNRIEPGRNYGWPVVSNGRDRVLQFSPTREGMESPRAHWSPTIAPAAIEFYAGDRYPRWANNLFLACLGGEQLRRIETDGDRVVHQEVLFRHLGRVRDVVTGPDGLLYLAMNNPGRIARLVPAE